MSKHNSLKGVTISKKEMQNFHHTDEAIKPNKEEHLSDKKQNGNRLESSNTESNSSYEKIQIEQGIKEQTKEISKQSISEIFHKNNFRRSDADVWDKIRNWNVPQFLSETQPNDKMTEEFQTYIQKNPAARDFQRLILELQDTLKKKNITLPTKNVGLNDYYKSLVEVCIRNEVQIKPVVENILSEAKK